MARSIMPLPRENRAKPKRPGSDNIQTMAGPPRTPPPPPARAIAAAPAPTTFYMINSSDDDYDNHSHSHMIRWHRSHRTDASAPARSNASATALCPSAAATSSAL
jgi:hypothetical protein